MHLHKIDTVLVKDNVRLDVLYESNPFAMGEAISLIIRLRHLGSAKADRQSMEKLQELEELRTEKHQQQGEDHTSWFMSNIWNSLNQEQRFKDEDHIKCINAWEKQKAYNKPVEFFSFYVQILGSFKYNANVVDAKRFQHTSKLVGVEPRTSEEKTRSERSNMDEIEKFVNTNMNGLSHAATQIDGGREGEQNQMDVPILVIPQTLLFTELTLNPGDLKVFHFKSAKLPLSLPHSYSMSKNFNISYVLQIGGITETTVPMTTVAFKFPLSICSYIDNRGCQYVSTLDQSTVILPPGHTKEISESKRRRTTSSIAATFPKRKSSVQSAEDINGYLKRQSDIKKEFRDLISNEENAGGEFDELTEKLLKFQFGDNIDSDHENVDDMSKLLDNKMHRALRSNIQLLKSNLASMSLPNIEPTGDSIQSVLNNLKKDYVVNRNGEMVCKINLSKLLYFKSEDIDLIIEFPGESKHKITAVTTTLEMVEVINHRFLRDKSRTKSKAITYPLYSTHSICFGECEKVPIKLLTYRSPSNIPLCQFITNVFQVKFMISFKFVLVDVENSSTLVEFYKDKHGKLFRAKDHLEGEEFTFYVPLTVLPTDKQFGGW
ncbi:Rgp1p Ecym_4238 [Eremothecium cymbalariae DBVPG|uniref:Uncharacterized protein n=1 Tax=Eremothecium cymbalariae (strain CBS 270.75 / DBVPG 7215 / KCTC 17166 / NRRL Y-17582) TaxID=931890 RepID=G8JTF1_ERECY|nr:hypothetical protein Ecym_4238 [Eremothecium cymbalariae DBVPG\